MKLLTYVLPTLTHLMPKFHKLSIVIRSMYRVGQIIKWHHFTFLLVTN